MKNLFLLRSILVLTLGLLAGGTGCHYKYDPEYAITWSITGTVWKVMELNGQMVGAKMIPTLQLEPNGKRVAAFGGVNDISGTYELTEDKLSFGAFNSTRMAGEETQMETEMKFMAALTSVTSYKAKGPWLELRSGKKVVARAQATTAVEFPKP